MSAAERLRPIFLAGEWRRRDALAVESAFDGVAEVATAGVKETREAITRSEKALARGFPAHTRARVLDEAARAIEEQRDEIARLIAQEVGKALKAAFVEADRPARTFKFGAVEERQLSGETVPMDAHPAGEGKSAPMTASSRAAKPARDRIMRSGT